ncbi:radical SAM protein [Clostridiaceae bacterium 35-E11]
MIISWNITKRCNLYCKHCYRESTSTPEENELSTQEGKKLIEEIAKAGFKILIFSGGEPILRKDLYTLIHHAKQIGLIPVLGSNGTLITKEVAQQLKKSGARTIGISLDSLHPNRHDTFRQSLGSFEKTLMGIRHCLEANLRVQINTTVNKNNKDEITKITDFAETLGASAHHLFFLVSVGRGKDIAEQALNPNEYIDAIHLILDKQKHTTIELKPTCAPQFMVEAKKQEMPMRFSRGCIAGIRYCCLLPNGDVHVCPYLPIKVGNVKNKPFDKIWAESEVFQTLRNYQHYKGQCGTCPHITICGGCRARAFSATGDYLDEDPSCLSI